MKITALMKITSILTFWTTAIGFVGTPAVWADDLDPKLQAAIKAVKAATTSELLAEFERRREARLKSAKNPLSGMMR